MIINLFRKRDNLQVSIDRLNEAMNDKETCDKAAASVFYGIGAAHFDIVNYMTAKQVELMRMEQDKKLIEIISHYQRLMSAINLNKGNI